VPSDVRIDPPEETPDSTRAVGEPVEREGHVLVALRGEIDLAVAGAVRDQLMAAANRSNAQLVVDARPVTFLDSSGINALVRARDRATALGGSFHLVAQQRVVLRVLELMQLERALHLVPDVDSALACPAHGEVPHTCGDR
jgi:anti-anti-sigma factor